MTVDIPEVFQGFAVDKPENWNKPKLTQYKHKPLNDDDVVIKVEYCGVCGSDVLTVRGGWGPLGRKDLVVGHEIAGYVTWVGKNVKTAKIGDRVGIGAQSGSCGHCFNCDNKIEQYCDTIVPTYNKSDPRADNYVSQGGYANYAIAKDIHVFQIPEGLPSVYAAPLLCGGLTVFSPLLKSLGENAKGKRVGIMGIGGLGHMAIQFAVALGAEVVAISRSSSKKAQALKMGAKDFIATHEDKEWAKKYHRHFDVVLNSAAGFSGLDFSSVLSVIKPEGVFNTVGVPESKELLHVNPMSLVFSGISIVGSLVGSREDALKMLDIAAKSNIRPWIEEVDINEENCGKVLKRCFEGDVRYRFVFTGFDKAFQ